MLNRLAENAPPLVLLIVGIPILFFYGIWFVFRLITILFFGTDEQRAKKAEDRRIEDEERAAEKAAEWKPTGRVFKKPTAAREWL